MLNPDIPRTWTEAEADAYWRGRRTTLREHAVAELAETAGNCRYFAVDLGERLASFGGPDPISPRPGWLVFDLSASFEMERAVQALMDLHREIDRRWRRKWPGLPPPRWKDPNAPTHKGTKQ